MRRSSATATTPTKSTTNVVSSVTTTNRVQTVTTSTVTNVNKPQTSVIVPISSARTKFFCQGMFALKRLQLANKTSSPVKKPVTATNAGRR